MAKSDPELKNLVEEFQVAIRLSHYDEVSKLCAKINKNLVHLLDRGLVGENEPGIEDEKFDDEERLQQLVGQITRKLRHRAQIASAYDEVCAFVRLQDMSSLARVVGALKLNEARKEVFNARHSAVKIVRQSIILLRSMKHDQDEWDLASRTGDIDPTKIETVMDDRLDFMAFQLDNLESVFPITHQDNNQSHTDLIKSIESDHRLFPQLTSSWFMNFAANFLDKELPLERFTLLIAIWIAAVDGDCQSKLDPIMNELIDGLAHEEAASSSVDDFLQLSQLGSIWLSERRRLRVVCMRSSRRFAGAPTSGGSMNLDYYPSSSNDDGDDDDADSQEDDDESDSSSSTSADISLANDEDAQSRMSINAANSRSSSVKLHKTPRKELKQIIEGQFLFGYKCFLCADKQSDKLLASLELDACSNCLSQLMVERCALSFKPLPVIKLDCLLNYRPKLKSLTLISGSEWLRYYLAASDLFKQMTKTTTSGDHKSSSLSPNASGNNSSERMQISDDFQKLTIIRSNDESQAEDEESDFVELDEDVDGAIGATKSGNEVHSKRTNEQPWYHHILSSLMRARQSRQPTMSELEDAISESVHMIRYVNEEAQRVVLNLSDILVMEQQPDSTNIHELDTLCVGLVVSNSWRCWGPIMSCTVRSSISGLQLGCGRLFSSFELQRACQNNKLCPFCDSGLIQLRSLDCMTR